MTNNVLRQCLRSSLDGMATHNQYKHYIHFSFGIVGNTVRVVGTNKSAVPPRHFGYHSRVTEPKIHSELDAYQRLRKMVPLSKVDWELVNVRVNRTGEMKVSKPCPVCQVWLKAVGCERVTYTTEDGWHSIVL